MYRISMSLPAFRLAVFFSLLATQAIAQQTATRAAESEPDILITDFEFETFPSDWKVTGDAFGTGPVTGPLEKQSWGDLVGFNGKRFANSFHGGEASVGTITLPEFVIERDYINLLVGNRGHVNYVLLIVDGKVVGKCHGMDVKLGSSETLVWDSIEVKEFIGRKATIQILDKGTEGGGHLNIDDIVQSNTQAAKWYVEMERKLPIKGKYLLVPVDNDKGPKHQLRITANGTLIHNLEVVLAHSANDAEWWGHLSLDGYWGKELAVSTRLFEGSRTLELFETSDEMRHLLPFKNERLRPQFHFSQSQGWNNDTIGMVHYDGEYHLSWICNPLGNWMTTQSSYWGHAVSPDMIHWKELPRVLRPNGRRSRNAHPAMAVRSCFSGSANVDIHNTAGWQTGDEKVIVAAFTDTGCGESIAYSNDRGRTFTVWEGNPIFKSNGRDPKLIWYEPARHWVIMVADVRDGRRGHSFYTSTNLKEWNRQGFVEASFECPEIFELPVDDDPADRRWVIYGGDAKYLIGSFDGKAFSPEYKELRRLHWGRFYASQCFNNPPDGRVVQMGWAVGAETDKEPQFDMPFNQGFSLPIRLTLRTNPEGNVRMYGYPIKEVDSLRKGVVASFENVHVSDDSPLDVDLGGQQLLDVNATVTIGDAKRITFVFGETTATYDAVAQRLDEMPLPMIDGRITIRLLVDRLQYELVGNDGAVYKTLHRHDAGDAIDALKVQSQRGTTNLALKIFEMNSIWD
jgi:fructan beta-fructosidase